MLAIVALTPDLKLRVRWVFQGEESLPFAPLLCVTHAACVPIDVHPWKVNAKSI